ncbi:MAG: SAM-dependent methyltransferase [Chitinophagaceae bacterium]|nr:MAG: SAM-dependent methyltransferase [Chitinophagaceae bacterium]
MSTGYQLHPASYRDPAGFIFRKHGTIYRQVNQSGAADYQALMDSGAYDSFTSKGWLVKHTGLNEKLTGTGEWYTTLRPEPVAITSYPWEWSFGMLKDSALLTLKLATESLQYGLSLKDATPFNTQWLNGRLVFIDTLSFEKYDEQLPWVAYRQFCETYLSPLLLMHYSKQPLQGIMAAYPDGIPLAITASLLPFRSRFRIPVALHIHLHARMSRTQSPARDPGKQRFSRTRMTNLLGNLQSLVQNLRLEERPTTWLDYYGEAGDRAGYLPAKKKLVEEWLSGLPDVKAITDLGANEGEFSLIAAAGDRQVLCTDMDPFCINRIYSRINATPILNIQPMVLDLSNPSPAAGFSNEEYPSFITRARADLVMALALVHHLCLGRNIPPDRLAAFLATMGKRLLVEYVPADDPKSLQLLEHKKDSPANYNRESLLAAFLLYFDMEKQSPITGSGRELWLMVKKTANGKPS